MEDRLIVAYALCAMMALILIAVAVRYFNNRRQFKMRQQGRGKGSENSGVQITDGVPAE